MTSLYEIDPINFILSIKLNFYFVLIVFCFVGCYALIDSLPEVVYRVCELIVIVARRNGQKWQETFFNNLLLQVYLLSIKAIFYKIAKW